MIDVPEVIELLNRAVAERGEYYAYPESDKRSDPSNLSSEPVCQYRIDDVPACIVGLVISYTHPDIRLREFNGAQVAMRVAEISNDFTSGAASLLSEVQFHQDSGSPWGVAVAVSLQEAGYND